MFFKKKEKPSRPLGVVPLRIAVMDASSPLIVFLIIWALAIVLPVEGFEVLGESSEWARYFGLAQMHPGLRVLFYIGLAWPIINADMVRSATIVFGARRSILFAEFFLAKDGKTKVFLNYRWQDVLEHPTCPDALKILYSICNPVRMRLLWWTVLIFCMALLILSRFPGEMPF